MKIHLLVIIIVITLCQGVIVHAQNLFPNPSFEKYSTCPTGMSQIALCDDWMKPNGNTTDYFNCALWNLGGATGMPSHGSGSIGGWAWLDLLVGATPHFAEHVGCDLITPLKKDSTYEIKIDVRVDNIGTSAQGVDSCFDFGFYFYDTLADTYVVDEVPQISVNSGFMDHQGAYKTFSFNYTPNDNYTKVIVGPYINTYTSGCSDLTFDGVMYYNYDNLRLTQAPAPLSETICAGDTFFIGQIFHTETGFYSDTLIASWGGDSIVQINLKVIPTPQLDSIADTTICDDAEYTLNEISGSNLSGNQGYYEKSQGSGSNYTSGDSIYSAQTIYVYDEIIVDSNLVCINEDSFIISTEYCPKEITNLIPNIITPNQDGYNDYFVVDINPNLDWSLDIYNRWGRNVYKTAYYKNEWNASDITDGVYFYHLHAQNDGKTEEYKGWLQVIR